MGGAPSPVAAPPGADSSASPTSGARRARRCITLAAVERTCSSQPVERPSSVAPTHDCAPVCAPTPAPEHEKWKEAGGPPASSKKWTAAGVAVDAAGTLAGAATGEGTCSEAGWLAPRADGDAPADDGDRPIPEAGARTEAIDSGVGAGGRGVGACSSGVLAGTGASVRHAGLDAEPPDRVGRQAVCGDGAGATVPTSSPISSTWRLAVSCPRLAPRALSSASEQRGGSSWCTILSAPPVAPKKAAPPSNLRWRRPRASCMAWRMALFCAYSRSE